MFRLEELLAQLKDKSTVEYKPSVDNNDEDDLCDSCKTHIGFQYFVLEPENSKQLLTPDASHRRLKQSQIRMRRLRRLPIHKHLMILPALMKERQWWTSSTV